MRLLPSSGVATRWLLLAILTGSYGAGAFGMLGISPLSPSLVAGFGLTRLQVALLVPSIYLGGLLFALPAGRLADRVGVRRSLLGGLIVGAVVAVAVAFIWRPLGVLDRGAPAGPMFAAAPSD
jgi:MFS family permease